MYEIKKISDKIVNISLTRGDSFFLQVNLTKGDEPFTPEEGSSLRFAFKRKYTDPIDTALVKSIPISTQLLELKPEDTKPYPMKKDYVYEIAYIDAAGHEDTFLKGTFTLTEEVV